MGRAFEYRKAAKMKRWSNMARVFTKVGREIAIAVRDGGADPAYNPRLRMAMQNAKTANMPKANVENAIKRASSKDAENYQEVVYEGYAPHGIAVIVETTTDNPTRTVANVRKYFNRAGGSLGTSGSVDYLFERKAIFRIKREDINLEDLELELIDYGLSKLEEEIKENGEKSEEILIYTEFTEFGTMQKYLESQGIEVHSSELIRLPTMQKKLSDEEAEDVIKMIDKMEEDDDIANVFHVMDMSE
jgi:YebC/PmpR family DNA-binding regulatory protein